DVAGKRIAYRDAVVEPANGERVEYLPLSDGPAHGVGSGLRSQLRGKVSGFLRICENLCGRGLVLALAVAFVIQEGEQPVVEDGAAEAGAELIPRELGFVGGGRSEEVACVEHTVA